MVTLNGAVKKKKKTTTMSTDNFMNGMPHTKGTAISNFLAYCRLLKEKENPVHAERKPYSNMNSTCLSSCSKVLQFKQLLVF